MFDSDCRKLSNGADIRIKTENKRKVIPSVTLNRDRWDSLYFWERLTNHLYTGLGFRPHSRHKNHVFTAEHLVFAVLVTSNRLLLIELNKPHYVEH